MTTIKDEEYDDIVKMKDAFIFYGETRLDPNFSTILATGIELMRRV